MHKLARYLAIVMLLALAAAAVSAQDSPAAKLIPAIAQSQFMKPPDDIRDYRYCEVIPVFLLGRSVHVEVYNTIGLNDCPAELWDSLDAKALAETYGAAEVKLNGPRYWVINKVVGEGESVTGKTADFGGIEMTLRATIEIKFGEGAVGSEFYTENKVLRSTTYTYAAGSTIYELTSPTGAVYRMQSYSQIIDPNLTINDLESLGERLDLPAGWRYQARVLSEESTLRAEGMAYVINDDLANAYQRVLGAASAQESPRSSPLQLHDGYWVTEVAAKGMPAPVTVINDMHIDPVASRVTIYAQYRLQSQVIAPPQVGPGECAQTRAEATVCYHPNAIYLNGSGEEIMEADGSGAWWVKHAWILGGEGYLNCELTAKEVYDDCIWVEGKLLDDGLTMKIGGIEAGQYFNIRKLLLDQEPIAYQVTLYRTPVDLAESDSAPVVQRVLTFACSEAVSALDNQARSCPGAASGIASQARNPADA